MIKKIKAAIFEKKTKQENKEQRKSNKKKTVVTIEEDKYNLLEGSAQNNEAYDNEYIFNKMDSKENVTSVLNKLDALIKRVSIDKNISKTFQNDKYTEELDIRVMEKTEEISDFPKIQFLKNSPITRYLKMGYTDEESKIIVELQSMNKEAISLDQILNKKLDFKKIRSMWLNELILEDLQECDIKLQTYLTLYYKMVNEEKCAKTRKVVDNIYYDKYEYSKREIKEKNLYYESLISNLNQCTETEEKEQLYKFISNELEIISSICQNKITDLYEICNYLNINVAEIEWIVKNKVLDISTSLKEKVLINSVNYSEEHLNLLSSAVIQSQLEMTTITSYKSDNIKELMDMDSILRKVEDEIEKYGFDEYLKEYLVHIYENYGLKTSDANILVELQEKNYNALDIVTVQENDIPPAYIKNLWFNELLNEHIFEFKDKDQILLICKYNLIDELKVMNTQITLDKLLLGKTRVRKIDIKTANLYFKKELIAMVDSKTTEKVFYYEKIHANLLILKNAMETKHTLKTTGELFGVSRERVRQIDDKLITRLRALVKCDISHINPSFHLGLTDISLKVLEYKPLKEEEYFVDGIVKPSQYFADKYKLRDNFYIYNEKVVSKNNKALFDEYMEFIAEGELSAQAILTDFLNTLEENDIYEEVMENNVVDLREVQGRLSRMTNIVHSGQYYRKYNITNSQIEQLISVIEELDIPNVFSTKLLIDMGIVEGLDIRNENELHNILKINKELFTIDVQFTRMPHITIGSVDIVEELYQLIDLDLLSSNQDEALKRLSDETGIKEQTLKGTYFTKLVNLVPTSDMTIPGITELEIKLDSLRGDIVHLDVLQEKFDTQLNNQMKEILKTKPLSGFKLKSNWLLKEKYKNVADFITQNVDEYGIFNESMLGASRYVHNYTTMKRTLWRSNIYKFNSNELLLINDSDLIRNLECLKDKLIYKFKFPYSMESLINSDDFYDLMKECELEVYGFSSCFWNDVICSSEKLKITCDIITFKEEGICYSDYLTGLTCSIYEYEEEFIEKIGCEPPTTYIKKLEEEGIFIKDDILYLDKEVYLEELRSVI